jgi:DNA polymerase-4
MDRSILHLDIAAFPVAVERVVDPGLRGRPVAVAPPGSARAPILAVSLEAAHEGVRPGMPVPEALRRCPGLRVLPANEPLYRRAAAAVLGLLGGYSPLVEPAGPGHVFLDLTGTGRLFGAAKDAAARIRREIEARLRLRAAAGVATNKLVSGVAARVIRPDGGLCDVFPGAEAPFLAPLPALLLPAARAPEARERLEDLSVSRVRDLLALSLPQLRFAFGWRGDRLHRQALGIDDAPVRPPGEAPSVAEEETLAEDSNDEAVVLRAAYRLCERCGARLRRLRARAGRLRLILRYADAVIEGREARLDPPAAADLLLFGAARGLLARVRQRRVRVRWLEARCLDLLRGPRQLDLFGPEAFAGSRDAGDPGAAAAGSPGAAPLRIGAAETLAEAVDRIRGRFGEGAIVAGRLFATHAGAGVGEVA